MAKDPCEGEWAGVHIHQVWFHADRADEHGVGSSADAKAWLQDVGESAKYVKRSKAKGHIVASVLDLRKYRCFRYGRWADDGVRFMYAGNPTGRTRPTWLQQAQDAGME